MPNKPGGKCLVCGNTLNKQQRKYMSNMFCANSTCKVKYWKARYGAARLKIRDKTVDTILDEYIKKVRTVPLKEMPPMRRRFEPIEGHSGMMYEKRGSR
jgi:ssDNA-binding Zn-finger/Zn-ribbon topoisomerase 1